MRLALTHQLGAIKLVQSSGGGGGATVPDAPTNVVATSNGTSGEANLTWDIPASDGGSEITGYTVTASPGGAWQTFFSNSGTMVGLTNNTDYTFTVVASNAIGDSAASSPSNSVRVESLGAELAAPLSGQAVWVASGTGASYTGGQAVFTASSSTAVVEQTSVVALNDNATYKVVVACNSYTQGKARVQVYGDTANHLGSTTDGGIAAVGTYTFYVTTSATGSLTNRIRIQTNGPSTPGNTLTINSISVKEVLA